MMIGGLIEQNLERDPSRQALLNGAVVAISAPDAEVAVTVRMGRGDVVVSDGVKPEAKVVITADSSLLLAMTASPLRFGLPDAFTKQGRAVLGDVLARRVRIRGLIGHPRILAGLTRLLSVHEPRG
jgi:hypothetical protein